MYVRVKRGDNESFRMCGVIKERKIRMRRGGVRFVEGGGMEITLSVVCWWSGTMLMEESENDNKILCWKYGKKRGLKVNADKEWYWEERKDGIRLWS